MTAATRRGAQVRPRERCGCTSKLICASSQCETQGAGNESSHQSLSNVSRMTNGAESAAVHTRSFLHPPGTLIGAPLSDTLIGGDKKMSPTDPGGGKKMSPTDPNAPFYIRLVPLSGVSTSAWHPYGRLLSTSARHPMGLLLRTFSLQSGA